MLLEDVFLPFLVVIQLRALLTGPKIFLCGVTLWLGR